MQSKLWFLAARILTVSLIFSGCASVAPPHNQVTHAEMVKRDHVMELQLIQKMESKLKFKRDLKVLGYLRKIAQTLVDGTPGLQGSRAIVSLIQDKKTKWKSYSLPGNRIYLSVSLLRTLQFENEIAAEMAIQFGHLLNQPLIARLSQSSQNSKAAQNSKNSKNIKTAQDDSHRDQVHEDHSEVFKNVDYFGPKGLFSFSEEAEISTMQTAVGLLYRAGYDARGLISLYNRFQENPSYSPYELGTINRLIDHTRQEIAIYAPLRNPIVRSEEFLLIRKRIKNL